TRPPRMERERTLKHFPTYGGINEGSSGETCPTCRGTGRIPRGHEGQLVAVIPCNDVRLKPRRTKLYVCISMGVCLFLCCLILFFLFPRSITMAPVSVLSVMVYIAPDTITMEVTNLINITNENFVPVQVADFSIQGLVAEQVVGKSKMTNMTALQSRSTYCKSKNIKIHTLFLVLMTMNISYLSHTEQLSLDTYEYVDCGANSTSPHPVRL
uniref:Transmembrane protein 106A n=1 Tax=Stegastes partitus TaxID=144197 RepID=A0A3B4Z2E4_9TELE